MIKNIRDEINREIYGVMVDVGRSIFILKEAAIRDAEKILYDTNLANMPHYIRLGMGPFFYNGYIR